MGLRTYLAIAFVLTLLGGAWMLKRELQANATLKQNNKQLQEVLAETEEAVQFQMTLGMVKDQKITTLLSARKITATELNDWKALYEAALTGKAENRAWADQPIPPDVRALLRPKPSDRQEGVRGRDAAIDFVRRLQQADGAPVGKDGRAADGAQGDSNRAGGLRNPGPRQ